MKKSLSKRKSIRLKHHDYSSGGYYFVTICTQNRRCLFGNISIATMVLNDAGKMIDVWWNKLPEKFKNVELDAFQTMPNHVHFIIRLVGAGFMPARNSGLPARSKRATTRVAPTAMLGDIAGAFKSLTTHEYINGVKNNGWPRFKKRLWQRNYYEHIIRTYGCIMMRPNDLNKIQTYIKNNPKTWDRDRNNPKYLGTHLKPISKKSVLYP